MHKKFEKQRCSDNREFFQCDSIEIMNYLNEIITEIWTRFFDEHFVFLQEGALNLTDDYKKELIKQLVLELVTNNSIPNQSLSNKIRFLDEIILMEYHYFIRDNRVYFAPIVIDMGSQGEVVDYMSTVKKMYNI